MNSSVIPLEVFSSQQRSDLDTLLSKSVSEDGTKIVFVEGNIFVAMRYLGWLNDASFRAKKIVGIYPLRETVDFLPAQHVVYIVNPNLETIRSLIVHLLSYTQRFPRATPHIVFAPQKPLMVEQIIVEEFKLSQTFSGLQLLEWDFDVVPYEEDLFSMELPLSFKHLFIDGDITEVRWIARLLLKLQTARFGAFSCVRGKGFRAGKVVRMLTQMQRDLGNDFIGDIPSEVDTLFVLDRSVDLVTPLLTQLTYEGLIDELFGISGCEAVFPFSFGESSKPGMDQKTVLDSRDKVFAELRDRNFSSVGSALYQKSVYVKQSYEKRKEVQQLKELKEFMKGLPEMQEIHRLVGVHTTIATDIGKRTQNAIFRRRIGVEQSIIQQMNEKDVLEFIEESICRKESLLSVLRLVCLLSVVNSGLKKKDYDSIRESMMLTYGIPQIISAFATLEKCGLLSKADGKSTYSAVRKQLRTWNTSLNEQQPNDIAYTYSGYASLLVRAVELLLISPEMWNSSDTLLDLIPGERTELRNPVEVTGTSRTALVFVIGGLTAAEVSSFRFVQERLQKAGRPHRLLVASTSILTGDRFINSLLPFNATG